MRKYDDWQFLNAGSGDEIAIGDLSLMIKDIVGFEGGLVFYSDKPDGTMRKLMDSEQLNNLGWKSNIDLKSGIENVYSEYKQV